MPPKSALQQLLRAQYFQKPEVVAALHTLLQPLAQDAPSDPVAYLASALSEGRVTPSPAHANTDSAARLDAAVQAATVALARAGPVDLRASLTPISTAVKALVDADRCTVFEADPSRQTVSAALPPDGAAFFRLPYGKGAAGIAAASKTAVRLDDPYAQPTFDTSLDRLIGTVSRAVLAVPVVVDGNVVAVFEASNDARRATFSPDDEQLLRAFASSVGVALRNSFAFLAVRRAKLDAARLTTAIATVAASSADVEARVSSVERAAVQLLQSAKQACVLRYPVKEQRSIAGSVAATGETIVVPSTADPRYNSSVDLTVAALGGSGGALVALPLLVGDAEGGPWVLEVAFPSGAVDGATERLAAQYASSIGPLLRTALQSRRTAALEARLADVAKGAAAVANANYGQFAVPADPSAQVTLLRTLATRGGAARAFLIAAVEDGGGVQVVVSSDDVPVDSTASESPLVHLLASVRRSQAVVLMDAEQVAASSVSSHPLLAVCDGSDASTTTTTPAIAKGLVVFPLQVSVGQPTAAAVVLVEPASSDVLLAAPPTATARHADPFAVQLGAHPQQQGATPTSDIAALLSLIASTLAVDCVFRIAETAGTDLAALVYYDDASHVEDVVDPEDADALLTLQFDIHKYRRGEAPAHHLPLLLLRLFEQLGVVGPLEINRGSLLKFFGLAQTKYKRVPYHSFFHAFDVTQTAGALLHLGDFDGVFSATERFAILLAAVAHDMGHMGLNNGYHLKAETPLGVFTTGAARHTSVLELYHCHVATDMIASTGLLDDMPQGDRSRVLRLMMQCIMATDMARHKDLCAAFSERLKPGVFDVTNIEERDLMGSMVLKMADISNVTKSFETARQWGLSVVAEFHAQGDEERNRGLDISPMCDRNEKTVFGQGQIGFIQYMALPFFKAAAEVRPTLAPLAAGVEANVQRWKEILAASDPSPSRESQEA